MLQRPWVSVVVAALWCLATGWLFVEKIAPSLSTGSPPGYGHSLAAGQPPVPVAWSVLWKDMPLGWALSESRRLDDGQIAVDSWLHLDRVPIDDMLPKWTAEVLATVLRPPGHAIRGQGMVVESKSRFRFDAGGRLRTFDAAVDLPGVEAPILFTGAMVDDTLSVSLRAGELRYETRQQVPWHAVSGDELSPRAVLLGLFPGRRWQVSIFSPLRSNGSTVEVLHAEVDGEEIADGKADGLSHEIGSGQLIDGLDEAIIGLSEAESKTFTTKLVAGEHVGQDAAVTVTVKSIKERELPEADDEFAQLASEFDTLEALRENLVEQVRRVKRIQQAEKIRDSALETLLELVDVPLPEAIVAAQVDSALHNAVHGMGHDEDKLAEVLVAQGSSREKFDAETREAAEKAVKTQLLMDAIADELDIQVGESDLSERLVLMSRQYGIEPQQLVNLLQQQNQLPVVYADVRRGLAVAAVVEKATVSDTAGELIDTTEFFGTPEAESETDSGSE
jgi:hypothetical protein